MNKGLLDDFQRATEYVLGLRDKNKDNVIDDKAHDSIELMKPHTKTLCGSFMALKNREENIEGKDIGKKD